MRKIIFLLSMMSYFAEISLCQETVLKNTEIYSFVDEEAVFPGGQDSMFVFIQKNIVFPESAKKQKSLGKCYLKFIVNDVGEIMNVQVVRGISNCPDCNEQAKRVIELMPHWKPGKINGKTVSSWYQIPISFVLEK